jgi:hypothetical protein
VSFCVLFMCKCVLCYCHPVATQLQLTNISYHIIPHHIKFYVSQHITRRGFPPTFPTQNTPVPSLHSLHFQVFHHVFNLPSTEGRAGSPWLSPES